MKTKAAISIEFRLHLGRVGARPFRAGFFPSALLVGAALLGAGGGFRAAAQFPAAPGNEAPGPSAGVYQIMVTDPRMRTLMNPGVGLNATLTFPYTGWDPVGQTWTSPLLYDATTQIAVSGAHQRESAPINQRYFPVTVGQNAGGRTADTILNYREYVYPHPASVGGFDFGFIFGPGLGRDEALWEFQKLTLAPLGPECCSNNCPPQVPPSGSLANLTVKAGHNNTYSPGTVLPRSIGLLQSVVAPVAVVPNAALDFPAKSFFDVYVEVTLPNIPGSISGAAFPLAGAVLINGAQPLVVASDLATGPWPPSGVYTHTGNSALQPWSVDLKFRDTSPALDPNTGNPYYVAGDILGTLVLAGLGTGLSPCSPSAASDFGDKVLGKPGQLAPRAVIGRIFPNALFPSPSSAYKSAPGTNFGGGSIDAVKFTEGATVLYARDFVVGSFFNPIPLPPPGSSALYTNTNTVVTFNLSMDGTNFIPTQATGRTEVRIDNTNALWGSASNSSTEILKLDVSGTSAFGAFKLRENATKASPGRHIVQATGSGSYKIGGYFDTALQYSFNNGISYRDGDRPIRLEQTATVDCGSSTASLSLTLLGPAIAKITWPDGRYRLQGKASLAPGSPWVEIPGVAPLIFGSSGKLGSRDCRMVVFCA
jgi:hypothetical protein